jgi:hypothetical protein
LTLPVDDIDNADLVEEALISIIIVEDDIAIGMSTLRKRFNEDNENYR